MKVFISWSGTRSKLAASAFRDYCDACLPGIDCFMSDVEITSGERWQDAVAKGLEEASTGVVFVTPENKEKPWILFESGALSKQVTNAVHIVRFDLQPEQLPRPLSQFQSPECSVEGFDDVLNAIWKDGYSRTITSHLFEKYKSTFAYGLAEQIAEIPADPPQGEPRYPEKTDEDFRTDILLRLDELSLAIANQSEKHVRRGDSTKAINQQLSDRESTELTTCRVLMDDIAIELSQNEYETASGLIPPLVEVSSRLGSRYPSLKILSDYLDGIKDMSTNQLRLHAKPIMLKLAQYRTLPIFTGL